MFHTPIWGWLRYINSQAISTGASSISLHAMMTSPLKRSQRRALTLTRSFANALKSRFSTFIPSYDWTNRKVDKPLNIPTTFKYEISPPRPLQQRIRIAPYYFPHPIYKLPVELLGRIFVLGAEDDAMFPVSVSHVCSAWRQIAFRTPSLWRRISLSPNEDMWRERIHRARACSLDVQLLPWVTTRPGRPRPQYLDVYTVQWYMYLVLPLIQHWRSLEIMFTDFAPFLWNSALSGCCSKSSRARALLLEDLSLMYRANDDSKEFCLFSGCAPRLRRVTLDGIRLTWLPSLFSNLSYLDYTHHGFTNSHQAVDDVLSILQVSSSLKELRLLFPQKRVRHTLPSRSNPVTRRIILPVLTHLQLRVEGGDIPYELAHLMTLISSPSLISLRLIDLGRRNTFFPHLHTFFRGYTVSPSLRILRIENGWYDSHMLTTVLRKLPNIRQLVIRRPNVPDQIIHMARSRKGSRWAGEPHGRGSRRFHHPSIQLT